MRSLRSTLTWWFGGSLIATYLLSAGLIWILATGDLRRDLAIAVSSEAESVAAALTTSDPRDVQELRALDADPVPIWIRLVDRTGATLAATPGYPDLRGPTPVPDPGGDGDDWNGDREDVDGVRYASAREAVVGRPGWIVETSARLSWVVAQERRLGWTLSLAGLVIVPLILLASHRISAWGLGPLSKLVEEIRTIDHSSLESRLWLEANAPSELASLADEFNAMLSRIQQTVEASHHFTTDASHELRNPLAVLRTSLEVTLRRPRSAEDYHEQLRKTLAEIERVQATVESLLLLARDAPGEVPRIDRRPVAVDRLVAATLSSFELAARSRGVSLAGDVEPGLAVLGEESLLRLLLFNLVDNAVRFSPDGQEVRVEARAAGDRVELFVVDRGPGVAPELGARLFERFAAGHDGGERVGGLGLAFARWVARRHGGELALEPTAVGTSFQVALPAAPSPAAVEA